MGLIYALSSLPRRDWRAFRKNVLVTYYVKTEELHVDGLYRYQLCGRIDCITIQRIN